MLKLIPNILTFARFALTLIFLAMILYSPYIANKPLFLDIAFVLFVVTEVTRIVDGDSPKLLEKTGLTEIWPSLSVAQYQGCEDSVRV